jgi:hypothetical protein
VSPHRLPTAPNGCPRGGRGLRGSPPGDRGRFHPHWHVGGTGVASGWRGRQNYFSKTHLRSLFKLPHPKNMPVTKLCSKFLQIQFHLFRSKIQDIKHADSGEVQSQCCQLCGPTSHVFWHMTLCHEVSRLQTFRSVFTFKSQQPFGAS